MTSGRMGDQERRQAFFYAEAEADAYDAAADLNTPMYSLMHQCLVDLVVKHLGESSSDAGSEVPRFILDIGAGTGAETIAVMERVPDTRVVALDLCEPMLRLLSDSLVRKGLQSAPGERCVLLHGDVCGDEAEPEALVSALEPWGARSYDVVMSALTLHHLTTEEKREVHHRIASVLRPGGLFINADLFSFQSRVLTEMVQEHTLAWIEKQFTNPDPELVPQFDQLGDRAGTLGDLWLEHCRDYNLPDPIEAVGTQPKPEAASQSQAQMLVDAGFSDVGCVFRFYQVGVLWARR